MYSKEGTTESQADDFGEESLSVWSEEAREGCQMSHACMRACHPWHGSTLAGSLARWLAGLLMTDT